MLLAISITSVGYKRITRQPLKYHAESAKRKPCLFCNATIQSYTVSNRLTCLFIALRSYAFRNRNGSNTPRLRTYNIYTSASTVFDSRFKDELRQLSRLAASGLAGEYQRVRLAEL